MSGASSPIHPSVEWAQRKDVIFLTINVDSCKEPVLDFSEDKLHVNGIGGPDKRAFDASIEFYKPIDYAKARHTPSERCIQFIIPKKESGPFWPRLLKSDKKVHWVKIDFNKWKDEDDESEDEAMNWDMNDMMGKMGGYGDANPGLDDDMGDSDNEDLPDLEDDLPADDEENEEGEKASASKKERDKDSKGETENGQHVVIHETAA